MLQRLSVSRATLANCPDIAQIGVYPLEIAKTRLALAKTGQYNVGCVCTSRLAPVVR